MNDKLQGNLEDGAQRSATAALTADDLALIHHLTVQTNSRIAGYVGEYLAAIRQQQSAAPDMLAKLEQIAVVCTDNMDANCNHRMALDFVRQIANDIITSTPMTAPTPVKRAGLT